VTGKNRIFGSSRTSFIQSFKKAGIVVKEKPVSKNKRKTDSLNLSISSSLASSG
jgi:hypothetical protein